MPLAPNTISPAVITPQVLPHFIPPPKLHPIEAANSSSIPSSLAYVRIIACEQLSIIGVLFLSSIALSMCLFISFAFLFIQIVIFLLLKHFFVKKKRKMWYTNQKL